MSWQLDSSTNHLNPVVHVSIVEELLKTLASHIMT